MDGQLRIFVGLKSELADQLKAMRCDELVAHVYETYGMTELDPENLRRHNFLSGVVVEGEVEEIGAKNGIEWVEIDSVMKAL